MVGRSHQPEHVDGQRLDALGTPDGGRLLACEPKTRRVTRMEPDGTITVLADRFEGKGFNEPNDLTVDSQGRIYAGARNDPASYTIFGKEVLAVADAMVVSVVEGLPNQQPGKTSSKGQNNSKCLGRI